MAEKSFTVEGLARLCKVDTETVRRWRKRGIRGVFLESPDSDGTKGKPILFSADAVRKFVAVFPKLQTPELRKELSIAGSDNSEAIVAQSAVSQPEVALGHDDRNFMVATLMEKEAKLLEELASTRSLLAKLRGE